MAPRLLSLYFMVFHADHLFFRPTKSACDNNRSRLSQARFCESLLQSQRFPMNNRLRKKEIATKQSKKHFVKLAVKAAKAV
jgi:hypothetical protein